MQLRVMSNYRTARVSYRAGQVIDVSEADAAALMADSPGSFEEVDAEVDAEVKAETKAPKDKMEKGAANKAAKK